MDKNVLRVPGPLKHSSEARSEADLQKEMRTYVAAQPGVRFLADVLTALHASPQPLRTPRNFYSAFPPRQVLQALTERADLRVRLLRAITGGAPTLLRRLSPADLAAQIELLVAEDLPASERALRAEEDRSLQVLDIYLKYLDPSDLAVYLPVATVWEYESYDGWWTTREAGAPVRALMAAELKSIRKHAVLTDSELLDIVGDEVFERDLPVAVRTTLRAAARKAAREGRPFKDSDLFASVRSADGARDLTDELVDNVALPVLRKVVARAAEILGLARDEAAITRTDQTPLPRAVPIPTPAPSTLTPTPVSPGRPALPTKGGRPPAGATPRPADPPAAPNRSTTQPVPMFGGQEEVVGPDQVVMIDEVSS
jgi:hypothetical protein